MEFNHPVYQYTFTWKLVILLCLSQQSLPNAILQKSLR